MKKIHKNLLFHHDGFPYCQFLSIDHHILFRLLAHFPSSDAPCIRSTLTRQVFLPSFFPNYLILPRLGSVASSTNLNISPGNCCADQRCASDPFLKRKETTSSSYSHSNRHSREAAHGPMHIMCHLSQFTGNQPAVYQRTNQPTRCPSSPFLSTAA